MLLSTQTAHLSTRLGDAEAVKTLCEAGFDALDFSMFYFQNPDYPLMKDGYQGYVKNLRDIASGYGVIFNQAHAPFPSYIEDNDAYNKLTFQQIVRSMEVASILGATMIIVHPFYTVDTSAMKQKNIDFYNSLKPYCEQYNLKIALENMWGWDAANQKIIPNVCSRGQQFAEYVDALDSRYFTACLDLGHCGLVGDNAPDMIRALGHDRLKALHVHDNDDIHDMHTAPYFGKMDWAAITAALAEIQYDGELTFESDNFYLPLPTDVLSSAAKFLHDIGRSLIKSIENAK